MIAVDVFEPIDHESVVQMVVDKIETMIVDGVLKGGARLPSEREMADAFHVSRPKLREALQVLESRNLVTVRQRLQQVGRHDLHAVVIGLGVVDLRLAALEDGVHHAHGHFGQFAGILEDGRRDFRPGPL